MTQPKFAPISIEDEVRPIYKLDVPRPWVPHRPGEFDPLAPRLPTATGPDQGYLALLAGRVADEVVLGEGEHLDDVLASCVAIGMARAARFGRAPVMKDLTYALGALGYLSSQPAELVRRRAELVGGTSHDEWRRHELVQRFDDELLGSSADRALHKILDVTGDPAAIESPTP